MQNKILNKYLRQYYIGGALFFGIAAGSGIIMHKKAQLHEKIAKIPVFYLTIQNKTI